MHTLSEYISNHQAHRLPEHISKRFLRQIVAGMKFLFDHHIIHRDLKSHNIFMKKNQYNVPILKIGDFGIADSQLTTHYDETLQDTSLEPHGSERVLRDRIGTLLYMAPEVLCDTSYDNRCDIWSIGVMFYEMLVGHTPFAAYAQSTTTLMKCILNIPTDALSPRVGITLSAETRQILQELLQPLPNNRITFERLFNHEYIDLAHLPCELSFQKGTELIQKARIYDEQMQKMSPNTTADNAERALKKTIDVYEEGASHLLASVEFRGVYNAKEVQGTIIECLNRIEALKEAKESLSKSKHLEQGWGFGSWFKGWSGTDVI
ncbi:hypothetical protein RTP6_000604 [Batrachochytrium dendrobatidis]